MSSKNFIALFIFSLLVLFFSEAFSATVQMPSFSLPKASDGKIVQSSEYEGQAMLVTFFATWCQPCIKEIPVLNELQKKYGDQSFKVVGLSVDIKGPKPVKELIEKEGIEYTILMADRTTANDFGGVIGIPTTFLINKKGHVVKKYPGYISQSTLEKDIKSIL
jgi:peroxiredoxin